MLLIEPAQTGCSKNTDQRLFFSLRHSIKAGVPMIELSLDTVFDLLGTRDISGSEKELEKLCIRVSELVALNGDQWVKDNRQNLLDEWECIVRQELMT